MEQARFLDPSTLHKWPDEYKLITGDVLVNSTGTGTVGRTRLFDSNCLGSYPFVVPDSHVTVVRTHPKVNSSYVHFYLSSVKGQEYIEDNLAGSTNQKELYVSVLENMLFPLPPLSEQNRITKTAEEWIKVIESIELQKQDLSSKIIGLKSRILDLAISGRLVQQDSTDESAIELLNRINPDFKPTDISHYENLPDSWCEISMGEICKLTDGIKMSGKRMPYIDVKYLRGTKECEIVDNGKHITANTKLILVDGENSGEVFNSPIEGYQGSTFKILDISKHLNVNYVLLLIRRSQKLLRENKVGSAIPHLNKKMFRELVVPIPPFKEQLRIVNEVDRYSTLLDSITAEL